MVKTTQEKLGEAYHRALVDLYQRFDPVSPRSLGSLWREQYGLHHCHETYLFGGEASWIEFPNDSDYTAFMLRWS